jgi:hypothetical protein
VQNVLEDRRRDYCEQHGRVVAALQSRDAEAPRRPFFPTSKQSELPCSGGDKVLFQHRHGDEKSRRR